jgi:DNA-binding SARP family transcriptional activator
MRIIEPRSPGGRPGGVAVADGSEPAPQTAGACTVRFTLLGALSMVVDGYPVRLSRLERALVATLVLERGQVVSVERIVDSLWAAAPPRSARGRVQALVSGLRRRLGPAAAVLRTEPTGYRLEVTAEQVDATRFEALVRGGRADAADGRPRSAVDKFRGALRLWPSPGPALEGVSAEAARAPTARLADLRLLALEECAQLEIELHGSTGLVADLREAATSDPARERPRAVLMGALQAEGRVAEALAVYREAFRFYRDELGIEPGAQLQRAQRQLLGARDGTGRAAVPGARQVRPDQLPPDVATVVGRSPLLAELAERVLHPDGAAAAPTVIAVSGMPGVGKSTVAIRLAHRVRHRFGAGCLYADLRGDDRHPVDPAAVAGQFLRALGCDPSTTPDDPQARFDLFRSITADRDLLIVLDNARDEVQVRGLLPASSSATVLVTGRRPLLAIDGVRPVHLDVLSPDASVELLAAVAGARRAEADPRATRRVAALCGGLPLALRVAGVRLAADDSLSMPAMAARLGDERHRLRHLSIADTGLRPVLDGAYRRLSAGAQRLVRRLGSPGTDGVSVADDDVLGELVDAQLVQLRGNCLRVHELVRLYARERHLAERAGLFAPAAHAGDDDEAGAQPDRGVDRGGDQQPPPEADVGHATGEPLARPLPDADQQRHVEQHEVAPGQRVAGQP